MRNKVTTKMRKNKEKRIETKEVTDNPLMRFAFPGVSENYFPMQKVNFQP